MHGNPKLISLPNWWATRFGSERGFCAMLARECSRIEEAVQSCPEDTREEAVRSCSRLLDASGPVSRCKVPIQTQALYPAIALCLQRACTKDPAYEDAFQLLGRC